MRSGQNRPIRVIISIMVALVLLGLGISYFYYKSVNESVDPRVRDARILYNKFNEFAAQSQYDSVFSLMDTLETIYRSIDHYKESYEVGVLYNNRAAGYISFYLQDEDPGSYPESKSLLNKAEYSVRQSIDIYENWINKYGAADENGIRDLLEENFTNGLNGYDDKTVNKFLKKRIGEIQEAQTENLRRLSVSYTNLGIIKRHQQKLDSAAIYYNKALELWDRNLTAENNLNILLNRPLKKRNLIQKLFPPEK